MTDPTTTLVSEAVQDRYDRDLFAFRVASSNLHESWLALIREQYARDQGPPDAEEDCSDLG